MWDGKPNAPSSLPTARDFLYDGMGHRVRQVVTRGATTTASSYLGGLALSDGLDTSRRLSWLL